jgi:hypothetical protein
MNMEVNFTACEHLDYEPKYGNCKRQLISRGKTKLCWKRPVPTDDIEFSLVQFCKLRGRINSPTGCLDKSSAVCSEFNEVVRVVDVPQEELDK